MERIEKLNKENQKTECDYVEMERTENIWRKWRF